jgi:hypothetical protein
VIDVERNAVQRVHTDFSQAVDLDEILHLD